MDAFGQRGQQQQRTSSSAFACGSNQNCGNQLTDTPSTRVAAPPGGRSSLSLAHDGGGDQFQQRGGGQGPPSMYAGSRPSSRQQPQEEGFHTPGWTREQPGDAPYKGEGCHGGEPSFGGRNRVSGNSYASGANQNQGNVMTDVPSTRVLRPPGGSSSMGDCLSWEDSGPASRPPTGGSRQSAGYGGQPVGGRGQGEEQQGYGGRGQMEQQPVGGRSQQQGYDARPQQGYDARPQQGYDARPQQGYDARTQQGYDARPQQSHDERPHSGFGERAFGERSRVSSNSFASSANQNSGNVLSDTPSTRVLRPPGGHSTFQLG